MGRFMGIRVLKLLGPRRPEFVCQITSVSETGEALQNHSL